MKSVAGKITDVGAAAFSSSRIAAVSTVAGKITDVGSTVLASRERAGPTVVARAVANGGVAECSERSTSRIAVARVIANSDALSEIFARKLDVA